MENNHSTHPHKNKVHRVLVKSHFVFFLFFLFGFCLDLIFSFKIFKDPAFIYFGIFLLLFGTFLIVWAQKVSRNFKKGEITKKTFTQGPYRFTRIPTNFGLLFLGVGFGIIMNAFFIVLTTLISFVVAKFVFLNKQEKILEEKYGAPYLAYKRSVKF